MTPSCDELFCPLNDYSSLFFLEKVASQKHDSAKAFFPKSTSCLSTFYLIHRQDLSTAITEQNDFPIENAIASNIYYRFYTIPVVSY